MDRFDDLSKEELYAILKLRVNVFVVEQQCAYAEIDDRDADAWHLRGLEGSDLIAYARVLPPGADGFPHIGRVVVRADHRRRGLAGELMRRCIDLLRREFGSDRSIVSAQAYLKAFYEAFGYRAIAQEYVWDGIPHIDMCLSGST